MGMNPNLKAKRLKILGSLASVGVLGAGLGAAAMIPGSAAFADSATTYQATLNPLNHVAAGGAGTLSLSLSGSQATVTEHVAGLASTFNGSPFPHVQHIHIEGQGQCPTTSADTNGDGVISTPEGQTAYGMIGTSLTTSGDTSPASAASLTTMPSGASFDYSRTITLDSATLASIQAGKAVIVVHGVDPTTLSKQAQAEKSPIVPSLPLAATAPALCGPLVAAQASTPAPSATAAPQMTAVPSGGVQTGGGSTSGVQDLGLFALGGALVLGGGGVVATRKVRAARVHS